MSSSLEGEAAHVVGGVALRNVSGRVCLLPVWPAVALLWRGHALSLPAVPWDQYEPNPKQKDVRLLKAAQWAFLPLYWSNWCGSRPWGRFGFAAQIRLSMWNSTIILTPRPSKVSPPPCLTASDRSTLLVGRFYTPLPAGWIP